MSIVRIGIAGYMGAGKSTCVQLMTNDKTVVVDADKEAKWLMTNDFIIKNALFKEFGDLIRDCDSINFGNLGKIAFSNLSALLRLNNVVHPPLIQLLRELLFDENVENSGQNTIILDAALIPLWNIENWFDYLLWIESPHQTRFERLMKKYEGRIDSNELDRRMKLQEQLFDSPGSKKWKIIQNVDEISKIKDCLKIRDDHNS